MGRKLAGSLIGPRGREIKNAIAAKLEAALGNSEGYQAYEGAPVEDFQAVIRRCCTDSLIGQVPTYAKEIDDLEKHIVRPPEVVDEAYGIWVKLDQAEYDALATKDPDTLYLIVDQGRTVTSYVGEQAVVASHVGIHDVQVMAGPDRSVSGSFSPLSLFRAGEAGLWIDVSDLSSCYTDDGPTNASADGDRLQLVRDLSGNNNHLFNDGGKASPVIHRDGNLWYMDNLTSPVHHKTPGRKTCHLSSENFTADGDFILSIVGTTSPDTRSAVLVEIGRAHHPVAHVSVLENRQGVEDHAWIRVIADHKPEHLTTGAYAKGILTITAEKSTRTLTAYLDGEVISRLILSGKTWFDQEGNVSKHITALVPNDRLLNCAKGRIYSIIAVWGRPLTQPRKTSGMNWLPSRDIADIIEWQRNKYQNTGTLEAPPGG